MYHCFQFLVSSFPPRISFLYSYIQHEIVLAAMFIQTWSHHLTFCGISFCYYCMHSFFILVVYSSLLISKICIMVIVIAANN